MFEAFVDEIMDRWQRFPGLHVYHYAPYEPGAIKRLMGRYATCEDEVDRMLRAGVFVDLYSITKQALRASVERYSIKDLEQFYGYQRQIELREASMNLRAFERTLELGQVDVVPQAVRVAVQAYNRDDCVSTLRLRDWLEGLRAGLVESGEDVPRPVPRDAEPSEEVDERQQQVLALMQQLLRDVPVDREERSDEEHAEERLWQGYEDDGLVMLAQSAQSVERMVAFGVEYSSTFPLVRDDTTYEMYEDPGPGKFALEVIVDRDGIVRFVRHGTSTDELEDAIVPLLSE